MSASIQLGVLELFANMGSNGKRQCLSERVSGNCGAVRAHRTMVDSESGLGNQKTYLRIS